MLSCSLITFAWSSHLAGRRIFPGRAGRGPLEGFQSEAGDRKGQIYPILTWGARMENKPTTASTASASSPWLTGLYQGGPLPGGRPGGRISVQGNTIAPASVASSATVSQASTQTSALPSRDMPASEPTKPIAGSPQAAMSGGHMPSLEEMKQMADTQAAPLLEKLKSDPEQQRIAEPGRSHLPHHPPVQTSCGLLRKGSPGRPQECCPSHQVGIQPLSRRRCRWGDRTAESGVEATTPKTPMRCSTWA